MQKACQILVGQHDFSSFRAAGCQANSPMRTLDELNVTEMLPCPYFPPSAERGQYDSFQQTTPLNSCMCRVELPIKSSVVESCQAERPNYSSGVEFGQQKRHRCFVITAHARSFLYHQVRLLVGVLKSVGTGDLTPDDVKRILEANNVNAASPMAPACGLYLGHVKYDLP